MRTKTFNIKAIASRFYLETQVKAEMARAFLRDARDWGDFYWQVERDAPTRLSIRAKNFISLRLCFECSFKAAAFALSQRSEAAEHAYREVRRCSHDLLRLLAACDVRCRGRFRLVTPLFRDSLRRINNFDMGVRYDLDFKTRLKTQDLRGYLFDGPVTGVVIDEEFQKAAIVEAGLVFRRAHAIYDSRFKRHRTCTGQEAVRVEDYIKRIVV